jgi:hypothetical protein
MKAINSAFENVNKSSAFSSLRNVYKAAKALDSSVTFRMVEKFVEQQHAYTLLKPVKTGKYLSTTAAGNHQEVQMDLMDVSSWDPSANDNVKFILIVVDVYSKFLLVEPIVNKSATSVVDAIQKVFNRHCYNVSLSDSGREFLNETHTRWRHTVGVQHRVPKSSEKAAIAERNIRTLRNRIGRYRTHFNKPRYVDDLQKIVNGINASFNRCLGASPNDVKSGKIKPNDSLNDFSWLEHRAKPRSKFNVGDFVRLSLTRGKFAKESHYSFSEEMFKICQILPTKPVTFIIQDLLGREIEGHVYGWELCRVSKQDGVFQVEKILKRKTVRGQRLCLIRWLGYSSDFDSWESCDKLVLQ